MELNTVEYSLKEHKQLSIGSTFIAKITGVHISGDLFISDRLVTISYTFTIDNPKEGDENEYKTKINP
jgi:hypothetical protein